MMPGTNQQRQMWSEDNMQEAIDAIRSKSMGYKLAAKTYSVPRSTLKRRVLEKNKISKGNRKGFLGGHQSVFSEEVELSLVSHLTEMSDRLFGLTSSDIRRLAFQLAESLKLKHTFSRKNKMAGWQWLKDFLKRHPQLSLRTPEATSIARASAFNKVQIEKYFNTLSALMERFKFPPESIYNMDESGFTTVQSRTERIVATKGRKQVGVATSAEKGQRFTAVCAMNAVGNYIPPAMIFPRKYMKQELIDKAPLGTVGYAQENGWMTTEIFLKWLSHFKVHSKPSENNKVLLLLDGHCSHKNIEVLEYAKKNHILLFCFPPHCTHRVQPLDVSFFGPLTTYYNQAIRIWMLQNEKRVVSHFQVGEIFSQAYAKAATVGNATSGFKKTGIYPLDPHVFPEWMFAPSKTTDITIGTSDSDAPIKHSQPSPETSSVKENEAEQASTSTAGQSNPKSDLTKLIQELSPIPMVTNQQKRKRINKSTHGAINTTPNLEEAREIHRQKREVEERKAAKKAKRNLAIDEKPENADPFSQSNDSDDSDAACIYCNGLYSESRKTDFWIRCQSCKLWAHTECADVNRKVKTFRCELCKP